RGRFRLREPRSALHSWNGNDAWSLLAAEWFRIGYVRLSRRRRGASDPGVVTTRIGASPRLRFRLTKNRGVSSPEALWIVPSKFNYATSSPALRVDEADRNFRQPDRLLILPPLSQARGLGMCSEVSSSGS